MNILSNCLINSLIIANIEMGKGIRSSSCHSGKRFQHIPSKKSNSNRKIKERRRKITQLITSEIEYPLIDCVTPSFIPFPLLPPLVFTDLSSKHPFLSSLLPSSSPFTPTLRRTRGEIHHKNSASLPLPPASPSCPFQSERFSRYEGGRGGGG